MKKKKVIKLKHWVVLKNFPLTELSVQEFGTTMDFDKICKAYSISPSKFRK